MTLLDMFKWNSDTLSAINDYKYKSFDGVNLVNYLLTNFSLTECQYNEPYLFKQMCANFMAVHDNMIKSLVDSVTSAIDLDISSYSYNHNIVTSGDNNIDNTGTTSNSGSSDNESLISAFNSSGYSPDKSASVSAHNNGEYKDNKKGNYNEKKNETYTEKTKPEDYLKALEHKMLIGMKDVYNEIASLFADELLICVW